jgi:hypothetical protein
MPGTAEDFAAASAKDAVDENIMNDSEVDFEWVIRGFLSYYFPTNHGWKGEEDIILAVYPSPPSLIYSVIFCATFSITSKPTMFSPSTSATSFLQNPSLKSPKLNLSQTGSPQTGANIRKCSNLLPRNFNKACSTYFGGHYHGLYSGSSDEEFDSRFTTHKAMTFLRRIRTQKFLAGRKVTETSFPAEAVGVISGDSDHGMMVIKQWLVEGGDEDYVDLEFKDTEIHITMEKEILEFVYVYVPSV